MVTIPNLAISFANGFIWSHMLLDVLNLNDAQHLVHQIEKLKHCRQFKWPNQSTIGFIYFELCKCRRSFHFSFKKKKENPFQMRKIPTISQNSFIALDVSSVSNVLVMCWFIASFCKRKKETSTISYQNTIPNVSHH